MRDWPGKYVIGLTGNIATGKSIVRRMLEHLGAYGVDADALAHRAIATGAPGYPLVVQAFGEGILDEEAQIDRSQLAKLVFADPSALQKLESIVHPLVLSAIDLLVRRARQPIIVIEAIKLLETDLADRCDAIWVVHASEVTQVGRLMEKRHLSFEVARERMRAQSSQKEKLDAAHVVIHNDGSFKQTWDQIQREWAKIPKPTRPLPQVVPPALPGRMSVRRGGPQDAALIAQFISRVGPSGRAVSRDDVLAAFGEKAYLLVETDGHLAALAGWQVENLVTRVDELYFEPGLPPDKAIPMLMETVEKASHDLQSEASLLFLPPELAHYAHYWRSTGYHPTTIRGLGVRVWQEAAIESMPKGTSMWFKRLRADRVLRPL